MLKVSSKREKEIEKVNQIVEVYKEDEIQRWIEDIENGEYGYLLSENGEDEFAFEYVALNESMIPYRKQPRTIEKWLDVHDFMDLYRRSYKIIDSELEFYLEDDKIKEFLETLNEDEQRLLDFNFETDKNGIWFYWPVSDIYMLSVPIDEIE